MKGRRDTYSLSWSISFHDVALWGSLGAPVCLGKEDLQSFANSLHLESVLLQP